MSSPASIIEVLSQQRTPQDYAKQQIGMNQQSQQTQDLATANEGQQIKNQTAQLEQQQMKQTLSDQDIMRKSFINAPDDPFGYALQNGISGSGALEFKDSILKTQTMALRLTAEQRKNYAEGHKNAGDVLYGFHDYLKNNPKLTDEQKQQAWQTNIFPTLNKFEPGTFTPQYPGDDGIAVTIGAHNLVDRILGASNTQSKIDLNQQKAVTEKAQAEKLAAELPNVKAQSDIAQLQLENMSPGGLTPEQQALDRQAAARLAMDQERLLENKRHNLQDENISGGHLGLDRQKFNMLFGPGGSYENLSDNQKQLAQRVADGDISIQQLGRLQDKELILNAATMLNPQANRAYAAKAAFTDPNSPQAKNLQTISRIVDHIGQFEQNSHKIGFAPMYYFGMNLTGDQAKLHETSQAISEELQKLTSGGVANSSQTEQWKNSLKSPSEEARQDAIDQISKLVGSQYIGMNQSYKAAIGKDLPMEQYVTPAARAWMTKKGLDVTEAAPSAADVTHVFNPKTNKKEPVSH
jgi:hypothetical protein